MQYPHAHTVHNTLHTAQPAVCLPTCLTVCLFISERISPIILCKFLEYQRCVRATKAEGIRHGVSKFLLVSFAFQAMGTPRHVVDTTSQSLRAITIGTISTMTIGTTAATILASTCGTRSSSGRRRSSGDGGDSGNQGVVQVESVWERVCLQSHAREGSLHCSSSTQQMARSAFSGRHTHWTSLFFLLGVAV